MHWDIKEQEEHFLWYTVVGTPPDVVVTTFHVIPVSPVPVAQSSQNVEFLHI